MPVLSCFAMKCLSENAIGKAEFFRQAWLINGRVGGSMAGKKYRFHGHGHYTIINGLIKQDDRDAKPF
ncbi:hypothetical protein [Neisseria wadsworthii]|uniref:hypothetical protein n=1 Tax=Neisseria wadsworthii TaxID=607711 RepID=UPI000D3262D9|nr:hypothetical protein [Neisseria wadsworthii]